MNNDHKPSPYRVSVAARLALLQVQLRLTDEQFENMSLKEFSWRLSRYRERLTHEAGAK